MKIIIFIDIYLFIIINNNVSKEKNKRKFVIKIYV